MDLGHRQVEFGGESALHFMGLAARSGDERFDLCVRFVARLGFYAGAYIHAVRCDGSDGLGYVGRR